MRILSRFVALMFCVSISWGGCIVAIADETADIAASLGIEPEPADYVVVLDTSGSMNKDNAWANAVEAVTGLAGSLAAGDRLSVLTFDEFTDVVWQGQYPFDVDALVAALPEVPDGERTDIGAGLEAALDVLERLDASPLAAVVLMTDGKITTEPDSLYKTMGSPAWETLQQRAAALGGDTAAFALGLAQVTDAAAMQRVFPDAELVDEVQLVDYLSGLSSELLLHRLSGVLAPDAGAQLSVSWGEGDVTIGSATAHVPVELTGLALSGGAGTVTATKTVALAPGESVTLPLEIADGFSGEAKLEGVAGSPWHATLAELDVALPTLADTPLVVLAAAEASPSESATSAVPSDQASPTQSQPVALADGAEATSLPAIPWALVGLAVLALGGGALLLRVRPRLRGSLTIEGAGYRHEMAASGHRMALPENPLGLRGNVRATRGAPTVRAGVSSSAKDAASARLMDGESVTMGDATLVWHDERTILENRLGLSRRG